VREKVGEVIGEIAENHVFEIDTMEIAQDHIRIFLSFPPRYSISRVVGMLKSISARVIFEEHPEVKRDLWGWRILGGRIFCANSRRQGHSGSYSEIY